MRWLAVLVAVAGCNRVLGLDPTREIDAFVAPGCSGSRFTGPFEFTSLTADNIFDPSQGEDPLELMVTLRLLPDNVYRMQRATRPDTASPFTYGELPFAAPQYFDNDPSITARGQRLLFHSNRIRDHQLWEATRTPDGTFDHPAIVASVEPIDHGFDASIDGLTIYYGNEVIVPDMPSLFPLYTASRPDLDSPFGEPTQLIADNVQYPAISPDQLEIYYHSPDGAIYRRVRPAIDEPFGPEEPVAPAGSGDPDVSPDARTLLFSDQGGHLQYMTRDCP
jgi:hypothetical protein